MRFLTASAAVLTALLTTLLVAPQPAAAANRQVSCRVTSQWTCVTAPLSTADTTIFHLSTQGIPNDPTGIRGDSFVIVRDLRIAGTPEVLREYRWYGDEHNHWRSQVYSTYQAELHCPTKCQNAVLYFANY
ncbi:hypothetical protein JIG36_02905 [Actinoplanes sp. LDG1-06]|uniref:Uncharacterized protein n=1 Tax=Paractinoplanes ovalisporus TaxID=2810368 RepID=A0ABS2A3T1_9ACTN|nr:hypothetical protein [Actinoplanes ovalisporus]MBM2614505.1 hypothetical protein [Actinoplanes ovalisporus]